MEDVERTNIVIVYSSNDRIGFILYNSYTMDIDRGNWNCYNCGRFEHLARNYRSQRIGNRIGEGRRLEYEQNNGQRSMTERGNEQSNLNREGDLIVFDYILITIDLQCSLE